MPPSLEQKTRPDTEASAPVVLFNALHKAPAGLNEMLQALAAVTGIHAADLRMHLIGAGLAGIKPKGGDAAAEDTVALLHDFGIPAAHFHGSRLEPEVPLPGVRHIEMTPESVLLKDRSESVLLRIDGSTRILMVLADLSGRIKNDLLGRMTYSRSVRPMTFFEALKKAAMTGEPVVDVYVCGGGNRGARMIEKDLVYLGLGDQMQASRVLNFLQIVRALQDVSAGFRTDYYFGIAALPRARPIHDRLCTKPDEAYCVLDRYGRYLLYAAEKGLLNSPADDPAITAAGDPAKVIEKNSGLPPPPPADPSSWRDRLCRRLPDKLLVILCVISFLTFGVLLPAPAAALAAAPGICIIPLLIAAGVHYGVKAFLHLRYKRTVENTPTSKIRSMSMGMVEVCGHVERVYDLRAPYSDTRCVHYRCRVFRRTQTHDGPQWRLIKNENSRTLPFNIRDKTGRVRIAPEGAALHITRNRQTFKTELPHLMSGLSIGPNTEVVEEVIPEGALIYVLGFAKISQPSGGGIRQEMLQRLRNLKRDPARLMRYDRNGDGKIDLTEWEDARSDVERRLYAESLQSPGGFYSENIVIGRSPLGSAPFIIADTEKALLHRIGLRIALQLAAGLCSLAAGIYLLVQLMSNQ